MKLFYKLLSLLLVIPLVACGNEGQKTESKPSLNIELTTIPDNFPKNDVPIVEGDIISAIAADPNVVKNSSIVDTWMITVNSKVPNIKQIIKESYEEKGFDTINNFEVTQNNKTIGIFLSPDYQANITITNTADAGRYLVYYNISKNLANQSITVNSPYSNSQK